MKFWDASAIVQLLVAQDATAKATGWAKNDPSMMVWWSTLVECASAIERLSREGMLGPGEIAKARDRLDRARSDWEEIGPSARVRDTALRFLRVHTLKAADALQLAAAFVASENDPTTLEFVCLDQRLGEAAAKEGFRVLS